MKHHSPLRSGFFAVCASAALGLAALSINAQTNPPPPNDPALPNDPARPARDPALPSTDLQTTAPVNKATRHNEKFISKISMLSGEQARISQIASQRAADAQVKSFAEQISTHCKGLEQEIDQLALSKSVIVPTGRSSSYDANDEQKWQNKDAKDFDGDYMKRVIKNHKDSIDTLEDYSKDNDSDPELVAFAQKHLPTLRSQLTQAESLKTQVD